MGLQPPPPSRAPRAGSVQITDRDRVLLAFAAEQRFVIADQIAVLLGVSVTTAAGRLRALSGGGYLHRERRLHLQPACHRITRDGLGAVGSDLPAPRRVDLATYRHDLGLGWLMLAAHRGRFGAVAEVISERHMRSHDGRASERCDRFGIRLGGTGPGGRQRLHYPDAVLVTATGHRVALELELSTKARDRRERILSAYGADRRIDAVVYLVDRPGVGAAIERSARRVGVSGILRVQRVTLGGAEAAAAGGQSAARQHRHGAAPAVPASR
ncbi:MAG: hypothetical protein WAL63_18200 [Solirubrobacteraceae bacterium]